ncbi:glycoside hydrolase family 78 protein [Flavobacterium saccharophilum]|uniref:alpha-L-rhamnosidase n=1 Tax=Flavobacterium saccharophilum TaxID=29534 RepID=A0A1M7HMP4_9FLAO|nr:glycoside hydrolase family 78 protein [Flavobacterium saccharophilum]SHM29821.1 alpha-L-rhamnosidase [Flavobacterium saccharophilum]
MIQQKHTIFFLFLLMNLVGFSQTPVNLNCEHLVNPLGIDVAQPRFSWLLKSNKDDVVQIAYQIQIAADSIALVKEKELVWTTGKVASEAMLTSYNGAALQSFTAYFWRVKVWSNKNKMEVSKINRFETAMLQASDWKGSWISDSHDKNYKPAPYFRKEITTAKTIKNARVYVTAGGLYEFYVNGKKVGNRMLDPMFTRYDRRNLYASLDITTYLQKGKNAFGLLLGNGWYNHQSTAVWNFDKTNWRNRPRCLVNIRITYSDNTTETIVTDETWKTADSPVIFNSIYTGEHYDARKEIKDWNKPNFDDQNWNKAILVKAPSSKLVSQQLHPIMVVAKLKPIKINGINDTLSVFTFPRNIAGTVEFSIKKALPGTVFRIKHAERLYKNGMVDLSNIDLHYRPTDNSDPFQTDIFIANGNDNESFSPKFNYKGFQFVEVTSSKPFKLDEDNLLALEMHSDVPAVGKIKTSNIVFNKIWEATNSSYLANLFGYPTDCPQREKNGWTGDAHTNVETGLYNFDGITIYEKWLADHQDEQQSDGGISNIIPNPGAFGYEFATGPDWTSSIAIIPWKIYEFYGDDSLLSKMYPNIKQYVDLIDKRYPTGITDWGLGDWVPVKSTSSKPLTSTMYYYIDVMILAKTAKLLGKTSDADHYFKLAEKIKNIFNEQFLNKATYLYCSGTQTELSGPLYWGLVPDEFRQKVADNLYKKVQETNFHLDVGLLGTKAILNALSENGYADAAYKMASQEDFPSWGYWIKNGATTLFENWPLNVEKNDASMNHIMFGEIGAWMYKGIGGIFPDENEPGFKHIILKPNFVKGLDYFESEHTSPYGKIVSNWKREKKNIIYKVTVPPNATATLYLEKKSTVTYNFNAINGTSEEGLYKVFQLTSGTYSFNIATE